MIFKNNTRKNRYKGCVFVPDKGLEIQKAFACKNNIKSSLMQEHQGVQTVLQGSKTPVKLTSTFQGGGAN